MGLFQKIKDWFTGKSGSTSKSSGGSYTVGGGRYDKAPTGNYGTSTYYRRALVRQQEEEKKKKEKVAKAFKADEYKPDPVKAAEAKKAPTPIQAYKQNKEAERKEYNKVTNDRYNVKGAKTSAERLKRRQAQKSQAFDAEALKFETKQHPLAMSAGRGVLNAVTLGGSDLAASKLTRGEAKGAEEYYQQNKIKAAEVAGEIAGTFLTFGITGGMSAKGVKAAAKALAPQAFEKGTARAVERVTASKLIQRAATKEALKRFGADGATKEVIAQIAKRRAERAVAELGKDAAINLTTGLVYDINNSTVDSENWKEFAANMGINAGINLALGGATSLVPQFRVGRAVRKNEAGDALIRRAIQNADNEVRPGEAVNIRELARDPRFNRRSLLAGAEEADQSLNRALISDADNVRIGDLVGPDRQVRVNPEAPNLARDANRARTLDNLVRNAEQGAPDANVNSPLNDLVRIPNQSEAARAARIREINTELDNVSNEILLRRNNASDAELRELNGRFTDLMNERNALEYSVREADNAYGNQRVVEDIANADSATSNQEVAEQVLKEDNAKAKAPSKRKRKSKAKAKAKNKVEETTVVVDGSKASSDTAKLAEKAGLDLNDENTVKKLIAYEDLQNELKGLKEGSDEWWKKSAEVDRAEIELGIRKSDGILKPEFKEEKIVKKTNRAPKAENVDDFAQVGGKEAQDVGIQPDKEIKAKPARKQKKIKPNVVTETQGQKLTKKIDKELGKETGEQIKPPKIQDVNKVEAKYNKGQASSQKDVTSRSAVTLFRNSTSEEQAKSIAKSINEGKYNYTRITNKGMMTDVAKQFHADPERYTKDLMSYADGSKELLQKDARDVQYMSWYVVNHTGPMLKNHPELKPLHDACTELVSDISSQSGQILQLNGVMMKASPLARRRATLKSIANILDKSVGVRKKGVTIDGVKVPLSGDKDARIKQIIGLIEKDSDMKTALEKLEKATTEAEMDKATADIMQASMRLKTRSGMDLFQQWRIAGMLGNAKTMVRNRVGNATFGTIRQVSNAVGSSVENYLAKNSDSAFVKEALENRTRSGVDLNIRRQARIKGDKLTDAAAKDAYEAWTTVENKLTRGGKYETKLPTGKTNNVAVKALDWWTNLVSGRLEKDDARALERNFREAYMKGAKHLEKNGKDLADEEVKELLIQRSVQEAQIATFREYNAAADVLTKWTNNLYDADASLGKKALGFAVESAVPFRKTPMNILKQSVNYSPAGLFAGFRNIKKAAANGDAELLHNAIDQFASGLTGTGIMISGFTLGYMYDAFTTNAGSKDYDSKFMKQQGVQNYSVTYTDPITNEAHSYTLDWLVPASTTFFAGVELANQIKAADGFSLMDFSKNIGEVSARVIEPVFETSMLSGVYNILNDLQGNGGANSDNTLGAPAIIARELGQNYLNSLVPTAVGQVARTAYSSDKQLTGQTDMEYWVNSMKNKMGLANTDIITDRLGADTTAYGDVKNKKESPKDYAVSALKNLVLPMNIQKVDLNQLDKEKIAEYRKRVNAGESPEDLAYLFPKKQYNKNFSVGDTDIKMTNVELSEYNQAKTKGGEEGMRFVLESIMFNRPIEGPDGKKILGPDAYSAEKKAKLLKQFKGKSLREVEQWLYDQPEFKKATDAERRRAINGLWSLSSQSKAHGARRVGEQAVYKSRGKDVNEYNFNNEISEKKRAALQPYIDSGVLTYEEAVDFARNAGKTYYYENDEGGTSQTYFNKTQMVEYLEKKGYSHEKAEALYNSFKNGSAKPYGSSSSGRRGYRRSGYRRRGRGGSSKKLVSNTIKSSPYKASSNITPKINVPTKAKSSRSGATSLASALQDIQKTQAKVAPPKRK